MPPLFWRCVKTKHLWLIAIDFVKFGTAVNEGEGAVLQTLSRGKKIPPSSHTTFIIGKNVVNVAQAMLCRQTLLAEEWDG